MGPATATRPFTRTWASCGKARWRAAAPSTSRTFSGTTATLSYDNLNHFTEWNAGSTNQEWYLYDALGNRVLRRFTNNNGTTMIVYAFGLEEHNYSGAGAHQNDTYYYSLGGRLLGALDGNGTTFYLTDTLGSILASFNNAAGGASVKGNQVFAPYGTGRYYKGNINTAKGFTGQYNDGSGLDYFNARYYDPVAGVFMSADKVQGNLQGMNPYAYVNGNPETHSDPTGLRPISECPTGGCNAPVDMGALTAAIQIWAHGYPSNSPSTTQGSGGLDPLDAAKAGLVGGKAIVAIIFKLTLDSLILGNPGAALADLGAAVSTVAPAIDDTETVGKLFGLGVHSAGTFQADLPSGARGAFETVSGVLSHVLNAAAAAYDAVDLYQNLRSGHPDYWSVAQDVTGLVAIALYYMSKLFKNPRLAEAAAALTLVTVGMQVGPFTLAVASIISNAVNNGSSSGDNQDRGKRDSFGGGSGIPPIPPLLPPLLPNSPQPSGGASFPSPQWGWGSELTI